MFNNATEQRTRGRGTMYKRTGMKSFLCKRNIIKVNKRTSMNKKEKFVIISQKASLIFYPHSSFRNSTSSSAPHLKIFITRVLRHWNKSTESLERNKHAYIWRGPRGNALPRKEIRIRVEKQLIQNTGSQQNCTR